MIIGKVLGFFFFFWFILDIHSTRKKIHQQVLITKDMATRKKRKYFYKTPSPSNLDTQKDMNLIKAHSCWVLGFCIFPLNLDTQNDMNLIEAQILVGFCLFPLNLDTQNDMNLIKAQILVGFCLFWPRCLHKSAQELVSLYTC
jgi:hypothetical protein